MVTSNILGRNPLGDEGRAQYSFITNTPLAFKISPDNSHTFTPRMALKLWRLSPIPPEFYYHFVDIKINHDRKVYILG